MTKTDLRPGDRVIVKVLPFDPAEEGVIFESQIGTDDKTIRVAFGNPLTNGRIQTVFVSRITEKL